MARKRLGLLKLLLLLVVLIIEDLARNKLDEDISIELAPPHKDQVLGQPVDRVFEQRVLQMGLFKEEGKGVHLAFASVDKLQERIQERPVGHVELHGLLDGGDGHQGRIRRGRAQR